MSSNRSYEQNNDNENEHDIGVKEIIYIALAYIAAFLVALWLMGII